MSCSPYLRARRTTTPCSDGLGTLRRCGGAPRTRGASRTRRRFPLHQRQLHLGDPLIQQGAEAQLRLFCTLGLTSRRVLLGNSAYLTREEGCPAVAKAR